MNPLLFVNWHRVHRRFRALMWIVACVLAVVVLFHAVPTQAYSERSRHPSAPLTSPAVGHAKWRP
jgi:uncharacterized membrane protein YdfJ with MMPL/SSD domain